jgi:hypothetical protein
VPRTKGLKIRLLLPKALLVWAATVAASAPVLGPSPAVLASAAQPQQTSVPQESAPAAPQLTDAAERQGPFAIGAQQYSVLLSEKVLRENGRPVASNVTPNSTLVDLQILDARGETVYQESFSYALADGRFSQALTASASLLSGRGGSALVIRFIEQAASPGTEGGLAAESWQVFGIVSGRLASFGAVLPLGQGGDITVGGVVAGVMRRGGIAVVPLASTAEELEFRAWTGNFYAFVPVRIDWVQGQWGEGEQCYELDSGTLLEKGCLMRVEAHREFQADKTDVVFVQLFADTDGNAYNSRQVAIRADSQVDFLKMLAAVHWATSGERVECRFDNVWLQVRIDGQEGWVHGEEAFEALGLPRRSPE